MFERHSDAILARLLDLHPKVIDLSLDRTLALLDRLGNPQDRLPPVVHVAGTNGKGSTIAFLRAILESAGFCVHVYSSPHLVYFHERIRLAGALIGEEALQALLEMCEKINDGRPITYFEITTCAAFKAFAETPADVLLLETGLGGRLDSTNVIVRPAVTILTPISMDHPQFLGNNIAEIAAEKAEIQKPNRPCVVGPQPEEALRVVEKVAKVKNAPQARFGIEWRIGETDSGLVFASAGKTIDLPRPALPGTHQIANAGMAVAAALELSAQGFDISDEALARGLMTACWPARMQKIKNGPICEKFNANWEIWLDGGHNAAAGQALADMFSNRDDKPLYLLFGMLNTKAAGDFLAPLAPHVRAARAIAIPGEKNSLSAECACRFALAQKIRCTSASSIDEALEEIARLPAGRVLICGSLYLAGVILARQEPPC